MAKLHTHCPHCGECLTKWEIEEQHCYECERDLPPEEPPVKTESFLERSIFENDDDFDLFFESQ